MVRNEERAGHVRKLKDLAKGADVEQVSKDCALRAHGQGRFGGGKEGMAGGRVEGGGLGTEGGLQGAEGWAGGRWPNGRRRAPPGRIRTRT